MELCDATLVDVFPRKIDQPAKYNGPKLPPDLDVLLQLARGLEYIHSQQLTHQNIKPENVLIHVDQTSKNVTMKWSGFGLCEPVDDRMSRIVGTLNWMAPEVLKEMEVESVPRLIGKKTDELSLGSVKSDVFSEGLVFGYFLAGGVHLYGSGDLEIRHNLRNGNPVNVPSKNTDLFIFPLIWTFYSLLHKYKPHKYE